MIATVVVVTTQERNVKANPGVKKYAFPKQISK